MSPHPRKQKNFAVGQQVVTDYEGWCDGNGYDHTLAFLASVLALQRLSHEERAQLFYVARSWRDGCSTPLSASGGGGPVTGPNPAIPGKSGVKSNTDVETVTSKPRPKRKAG